MDIRVRTIPHDRQRYDTCGDWRWLPDGITLDGGLLITVSALGNERYEALVAIHEIVEAVLCKALGVTADSVDAWDMEYERRRPEGDHSEPGDDSRAPYHRQHRCASVVEMLVAHEMGVNWQAYCAALEALG